MLLFCIAIRAETPTSTVPPTLRVCPLSAPALVGHAQEPLLPSRSCLSVLLSSTYLALRKHPLLLSIGAMLFPSPLLVGFHCCRRSVVQ